MLDMPARQAETLDAHARGIHMVNIETPAPAFTLRATDKRGFADYAGKPSSWPLPRCLHRCVRQRNVRLPDNMATLKRRCGRWASASIHLGPTLSSLEYNLEFELLSDLDREAVNAYEALRWPRRH